MRTWRGDKKNSFSSKFSKIRGGGFRTIRRVKYFRGLIIRLLGELGILLFCSPGFCGVGCILRALSSSGG